MLLLFKIKKKKFKLNYKNKLTNTITNWDILNTIRKDFPSGSVVKNLPANAGGTGSDPWPMKIPRAVEQLSLCATTIKPVL